MFKKIFIFIVVFFVFTNTFAQEESSKKIEVQSGVAGNQKSFCCRRTTDFKRR